MRWTSCCNCLSFLPLCCAIRHDRWLSSLAAPHDRERSSNRKLEAKGKQGGDHYDQWNMKIFTLNMEIEAILAKSSTFQPVIPPLCCD